MAAFFIFALGLLFLLWLLSEPLVIEYRRRRLRVRPFPEAWREILRRRVPYFRRLPTDLQLQLKQHIQVFLAEKRFVGCAGLTVTDEMRITIAAQACLLILNRRTGYYPNLREILIYPSAFIVDRVQSTGGGLFQEQRRVLLGESSSRGQVVLSWEDTVDGAADAEDGRNVVIHEFAHQLDQEKGHATGAPILSTRARYEQWSSVLSAEFHRLRTQTVNDESSLLDEYGASDPAEFFAVVSEVFFERPQRMAAEHPALYRELGSFYRLDPLSWVAHAPT